LSGGGSKKLQTRAGNGAGFFVLPKERNRLSGIPLLNNVLLSQADNETLNAFNFCGRTKLSLALG